MKAIGGMLIVPAVAAAVLCCGATDNRHPESTADEQIIAEGNNEFALQLYAKLRTGQGNLFFSPYSISTALSMTYAGARGRTATQMAEVLHFPAMSAGTAKGLMGWLCKKPAQTATFSSERFHSAFGALIRDLNARGASGAYELTVANALWGQTGYAFRQEFLQLVEDNYDGGLNKVDFVANAEAARRIINSWVQDKTRDKIKDLIKEGVLDSLTRLVLTNAIYFKGNWARQFDQDKTKEAPFTLSAAEKVDVPMMNQTEEFNYMQTDDFQALELPYVDDELSMIILLPRTADGLSALEQTLTMKNLSEWLSKLHRRQVEVSIPKFKLTSQFSLADVLVSLGMKDAFSPAKADFSAMTGRKELFISAVIHKAYVDVNEEGTEAAAATAVTMKLTAIRPDSIAVFRADHPFLFLIRDKRSASILFVGRLVNPKVQ